MQEDKNAFSNEGPLTRAFSEAPKGRHVSCLGLAIGGASKSAALMTPWLDAGKVGKWTSDGKQPKALGASAGTDTKENGQESRGIKREPKAGGTAIEWAKGKARFALARRLLSGQSLRPQNSSTKRHGGVSITGAGDWGQDVMVKLKNST